MPNKKIFSARKGIDQHAIKTQQNFDEAMLFHSSSSSPVNTSDMFSDESSGEEDYYIAESLDKAYVGFLRKSINMQNVIGAKSNTTFKAHFGETKNHVVIPHNSIKQIDAHNINEKNSSDIEEKFYTAKDMDKIYSDCPTRSAHVSTTNGVKSNMVTKQHSATDKYIDIIDCSHTKQHTDTQSAVDRSRKSKGNCYKSKSIDMERHNNYISANITRSNGLKSNMIIKGHLNAVQSNGITSYNSYKKLTDAQSFDKVKHNANTKNKYYAAKGMDVVSDNTATTSVRKSGANRVKSNEITAERLNAVEDKVKHNSNTKNKFYAAKGMDVICDNTVTTSVRKSSANIVKSNENTKQRLNAVEGKILTSCSQHKKLVDAQSVDKVKHNTISKENYYATKGTDTVCDNIRVPSARISSVNEVKSNANTKQCLNAVEGAVKTKRIQMHSEVLNVVEYDSVMSNNLVTKVMEQQNVSVIEVNSNIGDNQYTNCMNTMDDKLIDIDSIAEIVSTDDLIQKQNENTKQVIVYIWTLTTIILFIICCLFITKFPIHSSTVNALLNKEQVPTNSNYIQEDEPKYMYCRSIGFNETEKIVWTLVGKNDPILKTKICHRRLVNAYVHELTNYITQKILIIIDWCIHLFINKKTEIVAETVKPHTILNYSKTTDCICSVITYLINFFSSITDWLLHHCYNEISIFKHKEIMKPVVLSPRERIVEDVLKCKNVKDKNFVYHSLCYIMNLF